MNNEIYLDFNVYVSIFKKEAECDYLCSKIFELTKSGYIFPFSAAHLEELVVIMKRGGISDDDRKAIRKSYIALIRRFSQGYEYLPGVPDRDNVKEMLRNANKTAELETLRGEYVLYEKLHEEGVIQPEHLKTQLVKEHPSICLSRVLDRYELTDFAVKNDTFHIGRRNDDSLEKNFSKYQFETEGIETFERIQRIEVMGPNRLKKVEPKNLFANEKIMTLLAEWFLENEMCLSDLKTPAELMDNHYEREAVVTVVMNFLERIGYYQEKGNKHSKIRSRMHDVTHAVYGTNSKYVITNDGRFLHKLSATIHLLGLETTVLNFDDFLKYDFNKKNYKEQ